MERTGLREKGNEALRAVLPIAALVLALCFTLAPTPPGVLLAFLTGGVLLVLGMALFTLGAELSMTEMGARIGARMTRSKRLSVLLPLGFLLGLTVTVSEPDLQVLAGQVSAVPGPILIFSVAAGVGLFLLLALLRTVCAAPLRIVLLVSYAAVFVLAAFVPEELLAVAFDAGGVTTGPMTVPFIMALGAGVSSTRSDRAAAEDGFGLIALCSVGPILAVLLLGVLLRPEGTAYLPAAVPEFSDSAALGRILVRELGGYFGETARALLPITAFFAVYQIASLRLERRALLRIGFGLLCTWLGLSLFLTGANVGFLPAGAFLGAALASLPYRWCVVPAGMAMGFLIVRAEPAVYVLMKQTEELTDGAIPGGALRTALSVGVSLSVGLSMVRVLTGLPLLLFLLPGCALALILSFFVPPIFTAVAFDSGGVASGPMTAAFLLPFALGACGAVGGNAVTDAFGVVAMVAMTPLLTIQLLGLAGRLRRRRAAPVPAEPEDGRYEIIDL